ncbi:MAG: FAD-dependent oxidoreductase [Eubacteriales bacterium]|nr:FAD-dependent oxidoreductase [Eubacteriales bacterium]
MYDIIIVGGGPAGLTAALYALRANKTVLIIEKSAFGGQMTLSPKIENYPGFESLTGLELSDRMTEQVLLKGADIELDEVREIIDGDIKKVITAYGEYQAKAVIVATGVKHRQLGVDREEAFIGRGVYYCAVCDGGYFTGKEVILIGGGNSALQEATLLSDICKKVTIVQNLADFTGEAKMAAVVRSKQNVNCVFSTTVERIMGENEFSGVTVKNTETREITKLKADGMFVAIGLAPDNKAFENVITLDRWGYFDVGETCLTSTPGIFAAGDCRSKKIRQITTATGDGACAALAACDYIDRGGA